MSTLRSEGEIEPLFIAAEAEKRLRTCDTEKSKPLCNNKNAFSWSRYSTVFVIVLPYAEFPQSLNVSARIFFEESMSPVLLASET